MTRSIRHLFVALCLTTPLTTPLAAQSTRTTLSLAEALDLAKRNNPAYLQSITGRTRASAALRSAYGALLPSADASIGSSFREGRPQFFGGLAFGATSDIVSSSWGVGANTQLSLNTITTIRRANAALDAAEAQVDAALFNLRSGVTAQFIGALQAQARAALQDSLVVQQQLLLDLAKARAGVGQLTSLDVKRAEVGRGTQQVAALRARNAAAVARLQLFQQIGVAMPAGVALVADLPVDAPRFVLDDLLSTARSANPTLRALQAQERVAAAGVSAARGAYTPTLSLSANVGGVAQRQTDLAPALAQGAAQAAAQRASCLTTDSVRVGAGLRSIGAQCAAISFGPAQEAAIRAGNASSPFDFTRNPYTLSMGLSLPLFDGFGREQRLQEANASRTDARYAVRRQELALTAEITSAFVTLEAAYETVQLQSRNAGTAREALTLAEQRYRVGSTTFVDLTTSRAEYERAETDRIDAVYEFHRAFAALEAAAGRTLRPN